MAISRSTSLLSVPLGMPLRLGFVAFAQLHIGPEAAGAQGDHLVGLGEQADFHGPASPSPGLAPNWRVNLHSG
jgi:hypothetical protein